MTNIKAKHNNKNKATTTSKPVVTTRYRNDIPLRLLKECINYPIELKTANTSGNSKKNNSKIYQGTLKDVSDNMNVILDETTIIQGNKIKYIVLPDIMRFNPLLKGKDELVYKNKEVKKNFKNKISNKSQTETKKKNTKAKKEQKQTDAKDLAKELEKRESLKKEGVKNNKRKLEQEENKTNLPNEDKPDIKKAKKE
ncbi:hypothetical protein ACO0SA_004189 [Hanseniaspora valbyensis]